MGQQLRALIALAEEQGLVLSTPWEHTTICNYSFKKVQCSRWLLQAPGTHVEHNTYADKHSSK